MKQDTGLGATDVRRKPLNTRAPPQANDCYETQTQPITHEKIHCQKQSKITMNPWQIQVNYQYYHVFRKPYLTCGTLNTRMIWNHPAVGNISPCATHGPCLIWWSPKVSFSKTRLILVFLHLNTLIYIFSNCPLEISSHYQFVVFCYCYGPKSRISSPALALTSRFPIQDHFGCSQHSYWGFQNRCPCKQQGIPQLLQMNPVQRNGFFPREGIKAEKLKREESVFGDFFLFKFFDFFS